MDLVVFMTNLAIYIQHRLIYSVYNITYKISHLKSKDTMGDIQVVKKVVALDNLVISSVITIKFLLLCTIKHCYGQPPGNALKTGFPIVGWNTPKSTRRCTFDCNSR